MNLRAMLYQAFKKHGITKSKVFADYGIDLQAILDKLKEPPGKDYSIDHIVPCAAFDFSKDEEVRKCFSPENLQWLPKSENSRKSSLMEIDGKMVRIFYKRGGDDGTKKAGLENHIPEQKGL